VRALGTIASLVKLAVALIVALIAIGAVLYVIDADQDSDLAADVIDLSDRFVFTRSLIELDDNDVQLPLNYGISAVIWIAGAALLLAGLRVGARAVRDRRREQRAGRDD